MSKLKHTQLSKYENMKKDYMKSDQQDKGLVHDFFHCIRFETRGKSD